MDNKDKKIAWLEMELRNQNEKTIALLRLIKQFAEDKIKEIKGFDYGRLD